MKYHPEYTHYQPIDRLFREIEADFYSGRLGIQDNGEIIPLSNIYDDAAHAAFHIPHDDKADRRTCPHCGTAYRNSEIKQGRCPYCWRLI